MFASWGIASLAAAPVRSALMFCGAAAIFLAWWTVARKYRMVVDDGTNIVVGDGPGKITVSKKDIKSVKAVPFMKTPVFKITAQTTDGVVHFYFAANRGIVESRILENGSSRERAEK